MTELRLHAAAPDHVIADEMRRLGVEATAEISDLAASVRRLVDGREPSHAAITALMVRMEALSGALCFILDSSGMPVEQVRAIVHEGEANG